MSVQGSSWKMSVFRHTHTHVTVTHTQPFHLIERSTFRRLHLFDTNGHPSRATVAATDQARPSTPDTTNTTATWKTTTAANLNNSGGSCGAVRVPSLSHLEAPSSSPDSSAHGHGQGDRARSDQPSPLWRAP